MKKHHILLVDDDSDYLFQQKLVLEEGGYLVTTAQTLKEAISFIKSTQPDLAVIDLMMEEMDAGMSLAYEIKQLPSKPPVIMVTGVTAQTGIIFPPNPGSDHPWIKADRILTKPLTPEQLLGEVKRFLS